VFDSTEVAAEESVVVDPNVMQPEAPMPLGPVIGFANPQPQSMGRSFLDAVEVSAELVGVDDVDEVEASAASQETPAESSPSLPPPLPRVSTPPPLAAQASTSPLDALAELSMSDAEEVAGEEIEESASDDAPSLDALAALTSQPRRG
jgi:hypothetical protein